MPKEAKRLRWTLRKFGFSDSAINAAWPGWWSDDAETSVSAYNELRFSLARKLGLDPRSLLEDKEPRFVWRDEAKFKQLSSENDRDRGAISSFGISVGRSLIGATNAGPSLAGVAPGELRRSILANAPFVRLIDLLGLCWGVGIPVIHLRVFPLSAKRMCAMSVRIGDRYAILLAKDANFPAPIAFYLAHELGHVTSGHLDDVAAVVDLQDPLDATNSDEEEREADRYALELLTGTPEPTVDTEVRRFGAHQLAQNLLQTGEELRIEPGTLALCFGYSTGRWDKANAAIKKIYTTSKPVWSQVNQVAQEQLDWPAMSDDLAFFVRAVMGGVLNDDGGG